MSILRERIIDEHIKKNYPNAQLLNYNDPDCDFVFYSAEELQSVESDWFPLCCYKDSESGRAMYGGRKKVFHTYTEGETGAGKTTRFVMQSILALSSMKVKPSFVIVDIHGEIIENLYNHLKQNGYKIKILNCDNPQRSDTYNPFSELAEECLKTRTIDNEAINKIRKISEIIQPVESSNDPIWDRGARSYTNGCIIDKFEDLINGDIPKDCLTIYNVIQNHYWLRETMSGGFRINGLFDIPHYKKKGSKALSTQKMISVTNNAEKTRASYFGVVENHYDSFGQPSLYSLSSSNTIDISDFVDEPTVIVIQSGSTKIGDDLISLLVNEIYTYVVKTGKDSKSKRLPRNIHCFLDEFANCNIADGPEYIKMLTTSRKFGMFWHMILQCDAQLDRKFDPNIGKIIRANSTEIFMGSHDYETEVRFAKSCGQKTIESLASTVAQQDPRLEVVDLMTPEELNLMEEGYIYIKSNRHPLTRTYIEAFYNCEEFIPVNDIDVVYPHNTFEYQQTSFYPDDIPPAISSSEYGVLTFLKNGKRSLHDIMTHFSSLDVKKILRALAMKGLIELLDYHMVRKNFTKRQYNIFSYRETNGFNSKSELYIQPVSLAPKRTGSVVEDFWDDDDYYERMDEKPSGTDDIDCWLYGVEPLEDPMIRELKDHLYGAGIKDALKRIEKITMVPDFLTEILKYLALSEDEQKKSQATFPDTTTVVKYEIIEKFIGKNNFSTKKAWESRMQKEYDHLKSENVFPESIMVFFDDAMRELKELTISNIREIKKIISDNE